MYITQTHFSTGKYTSCRSCRHPLLLGVETEECEKFESGIQCRYCADTLTDKQRAANKERQLQMTIAEQRNTVHLGYIKPKYVKREQKHVSTMSSSNTPLESNYEAAIASTAQGSHTVFRSAIADELPLTAADIIHTTDNLNLL